MEETDLQKATKGLAGHFRKAAAHHEAMAAHHDGIAKAHQEHADHHEACMSCHKEMSAAYKAAGKREGADAEHNKAMSAHHESLHDHHKGLQAAHKAASAHHMKCFKAHTSHSEHSVKMAADFEQEGKVKNVEIQKTQAEIDAENALKKATDDAAKKAAEEAALKAQPGAGDGAIDVQGLLQKSMKEALAAGMVEVQKSPEFQKMIQDAVLAQVSSTLGTKLVPTEVKVAGTQLIGRDGRAFEVPATETGDETGL